MKSFTIAMIAATASSRWVTISWCYKPGQFPDADGWWQNSDGKWVEDGKGIDRNTKGVWIDEVVDKNCGEHYVADQKTWEVNELEYAKMMAEYKMRDAVDEAMDIKRDIERIDVEYMLADAMRQLRCLWAGFEPVDEGKCQSQMEFERQICEDRGMFYGEAWNYCMKKGSQEYDDYMWWQNNSEKKSMRQRIDVAKKAMVKYEVGISDGELQDIVAESMQLQQEG